MSNDVTKAMRFTKHDWKLISEFLHANPIFDFSTLARTAILAFIRDPKITLKAIPRSVSQELANSDLTEVKNANR